MFDVELFLQVPIDIRLKVYFQLDKQLTYLKSNSKYELFLPQYNLISFPKVEYSPIFEKQRLKYYDFLQVYEYLPNFVDNWTILSLWLPFDSIILDYFRLNHLYQYDLCKLQFIEVDKEVKLALFDHEGLLQICYEIERYIRLVVDPYNQNMKRNYESSINFFNDIELYTSIDLINIMPKSLMNIYNQVKHKKLLNSVKSISFNQDDDDRNELNESSTFMIQQLETFKNLSQLEIYSQHLFDKMVNFHGFRDNPGKTLGYLIKKRILNIHLFLCTQIGLEFDKADFSRWENLNLLVINQCGEINLNHIILPKSCRELVIKNADILIWKNNDEIYKDLNPSWMKIICESKFMANIQIIDNKQITKENQLKIFQCKASVQEMFGYLNLIKLINIRFIKGNLIIPSIMYNNGRFHKVNCFGNNCIIIV